MKILMLGWELPPHNSGGLGPACLYLSRALSEQGAQIDFVVPYEADHSEIKHMRVLHATKLDPLYKWGVGAYDSKYLDSVIFPEKDLKKLLSIRDVQHKYCAFVNHYLMEYKPDLVHAHDWLTYEAGVLAKRNYGLPLVAHVHSTEYDRSGMHGGNPVVHAVEREGLMMADKILAVSDGTRRQVHEKYGIPLDKIDVVYNSLGDDFLRTAYEYDANHHKYLEMLKQSGYTIISTVGRFTVQKGLVHLLRATARALQKHPKIILVLAGDGEQKRELMDLSAELGISQNVIFTGFIRGRELRDVYSVSDVFVMSSVSEPFGLTALEAAHHGNVLILTKQSGVAEVIRSAMTYDFWDEEKLANELIAVAESNGLRATLRDGVLREYMRISWNDVAHKCISVYNDVYRRTR